MYGSRIMSKKDGQRCVEDSTKLLEILEIVTKRDLAPPVILLYLTSDFQIQSNGESILCSWEKNTEKIRLFMAWYLNCSSVLYRIVVASVE